MSEFIRGYDPKTTLNATDSFLFQRGGSYYYIEKSDMASAIGSTLTQILVNGNTTGGTDIVVTSGDLIKSTSRNDYLELVPDTIAKIVSGTAYIQAEYDSDVSLGAGAGQVVQLISDTAVYLRAPLVQIGAASSKSAITRWYNSTNANTIIIQTGVTSASYTLTLPTAQGTSGQTLSNDGSGVLSWVTPSTGSGTVNSGTQYRLAYYAATGTAVSEAAAITASRALVSDANGVPTHSATTSTELGYVSGVTSAIQTQLDEKVDTIRFMAAATTLADSTSYFMGAPWAATLVATTSDTRRQIKAKYTGVIDQVQLYFVTTGGSGENITVKLANITQATSTTLTTTLNVAAATYFFDYTSLNFAVTAGDMISIQFDIPVMATNPSITFFADVVFKY